MSLYVAEQSISNSENETQSTQNWCEKDNHWGRQASSVRAILRQKSSYSTSHINARIYWPTQLTVMGKDYHSKIAISRVSSMKFGEGCSEHLAGS